MVFVTEADRNHYGGIAMTNEMNLVLLKTRYYVHCVTQLYVYMIEITLVVLL